MKKLITICLLGAFALAAKAQTTAATVPETQPFGKISKEDLEMKACDFEKDANAEVLFNKGELYFDNNFNIVEEIHKRIKIFNDNGKDAANIRIEFYGGTRVEGVMGLQAQTINLVDGKIEITKLDKKLVYLQHIDKQRDVYVFSMPNVKAGSIIEYKYTWTSSSVDNFPDWYFQEKIPVRYSEFDTAIPEFFYYKTQTRVYVPYYKDTRSTQSKSLGTGSEAVPYNEEHRLWAMAKVLSLQDEPDMRSDVDNLQSLSFQLTTITNLSGIQKSFLDTWPKVGGALADNEDFGGQLKRKLNGEDAIIAKAAALKTNDEKIAFIFNEVKNTMKWNGIDRFLTSDGTVKAWETKTGNSTEVNLILYHLLKKAGVEAYPMVVSTRENGRVNPYNPLVYQFNRGVVYVPVDSTKKYVLDATDKYNVYSEIPENLLNSSGLYIDKESKTFNIILIQKKEAVRQTVLISAEIKPDAKMTGTVQISSSAYNRINAIKKYKKDGEKKYIDYLRDKDNDLQISSLTLENMEVDSLPLTQNINFTLNLTGSDENYIYFTPNLFTSLHSNPFLSENRFTDIDFGYQKSYAINGVYKVPAGFKVDALPKSISMTMPDKSISFRRIVAYQEGSIVVRYSIFYAKSIYFKQDYPDFHEFFKKMHEMLNEQIVLKKG